MSTEVAGAAPARATRQFRNSHVPWIGDVPEHWDVVLLRLVARIESGHTPSRQHPEYWVPDECVIPWFSLADVWQLREGDQKFLGETAECISELGIRNSAARLLPAGTVVLSRTASVGFSGIMPRPMATTQDFVNWVCGPRTFPDYLMWVFRAMKPEFDRLVMGSTHQTIYMPDVARFRGPLPPLDEQRAIAAFLDHETARIDALVEKKRRQIALLHEKRAALICHAVTKGLDPNAPMKDSGIDWLAQIPNTWSVLPFRRVIRTVEQGWSPVADDREAEAEEWAVLKLSSVAQGHFRPGKHKALPSNLEPEVRYEVREGDLLLTRSNTPERVGDACFVRKTPPRLIMSDLIYRLHLDQRRCLHAFASYWLISRAGRAAIEADARGTSGSMVKVAQSHIRAWPLILPPVEEQERIVRQLDLGLSRLNGLVHKVTLSIERLREYRAALITAAVTGKIDVRQGVT